ncbi:MAG: RCC1 domain-containing protein [Byssovorax sp.]
MISSLGNGHACRLAPTGRVACWGRNDHGQLGDGTVVPRAAPSCPWMASTT